MIPGLRMPDPRMLNDEQLLAAVRQLDAHWDHLIMLSAKHGNANILWLDEYYGKLVMEVMRRNERYTARRVVSLDIPSTREGPSTVHLY